MTTDNKHNKETNTPIEGHEYDGIQELDNPLPGWWVSTFYITIIFAVIYFGYYSLGNGPTLTQEFETNQKARETTAMNNTKPSEGPTEAELENVFKDSSRVKAGAEVFTAKCASCHGPQGQGLIGPNLADKFWINGNGKLSDIAKIISIGVAEKGMPPWGAMLKTEELQNVTAYVRSLKGTNPSNPKAPQGTEKE